MMGQMQSLSAGGASLLADSSVCRKALLAAILSPRAIGTLRASSDLRPLSPFLSQPCSSFCSSCGAKYVRRWPSFQSVNAGMSLGFSVGSFPFIPSSVSACTSSRVSPRFALSSYSALSPFLSSSSPPAVASPTAAATRVSSPPSETPSREWEACSTKRHLWFSSKDTQETPADREGTAANVNEGTTAGSSQASEKRSGDNDTQAQGPPVVTFTSADGQTELQCPYRTGQTVLMVAFENDVGIEGACGGQCACSTCHVILNAADFAKFPEADDDEQDMLDLAVHTTNTSRLGCRLKLGEEHNGVKLQLPVATVNQMYR
ncbi:putative ferredoxin [Toxoplasma gondii FOU]|uniref:Putative ferredoxin n=3 Tax=Toxoplasma gondii TaxID=5811 RepID=A0A086JKE3_TOXGO|nr:putative ferredoxin [Toxoplasma gondii FOU]PUA84834.1 putative ferredoxin [Toxoplasma gondii TgCATBr9]RQX70169.1 putative ferredoxin [Toxoplasma gondii CAST]